ncbi:MAG: polysaccharide biosynthesis/export family protein [Pseudomonadota bacterium]
MKSLTIGAIAVLLAGCSVVPSEGPLKDDIIEAPAPLIVVEAEGSVIQALDARPRAELGDVFETNGSGARLSIAPGDVINVTIYETASDDLVAGLFDGRALPPQTVSRQGTILVPFIGHIHVLGRSAESVSNEIAEKLAVKTIDPSVIVTIDKRRSNSVSVVGDAAEGGVILLEPGSERLLDVVAQNGGISVPVHEVVVALTRRERRVSMPFHLILKEPRHNVRLMPGDVIAVTHDPKTFVASGANRSSVVSLREGQTTLAEGLAMAGGLLDQRADPGGVFVLRFEPIDFITNDLGRGPVIEPMVPTVYRFDYRDPGDIFLSRRFVLQDDDIVYVSNAPIVQVQKFLDLFRTTLGTAGSAANFTN